VGPVHGFLTHLSAIGANLDLENGELIILTPLGAKVNLLKHPLTHVQACIRDACRYQVLKTLRDRNANEKLPGRKDMADMPDYVNQRATMSLAKQRKKRKPNIDAPLNEEDMCRVCDLDPKERRQLHSILAGSIRTPARLAHTTDVKATCTHPECNGAKVDAEHMFWECKRWDKQRDPFLKAIDLKLSKIMIESGSKQPRLQKSSERYNYARAI
jgi:hypothetical protein